MGAVVGLLVVYPVDSGVSLSGRQSQLYLCGSNGLSRLGSSNVGAPENRAGHHAHMLGLRHALLLIAVDDGIDPGTGDLSLAVLVLTYVDLVHADRHNGCVLAGLLLVAVLGRAATENNLLSLLNILDPGSCIAEHADTDERLILVDVGVVRLLCLNVLPQQCPGVPPDKDGQILNGRLVVGGLAESANARDNALHEEGVGYNVAVLVQGVADVHRQEALLIVLHD